MSTPHHSPLARPDDLIAAAVSDGIDRGARRIGVQLEGPSAIVTFDAVTGFEILAPAAVAALSARMAIEVCAGGRRRSAVIAAGHRLGPIRDHGPSERCASRLSLMIDPERPERFDTRAVRRRLEALCLMRPHARVRLDGACLTEPRGMSGAVARLAGSGVLHPRPLRFAGHRCGVQVDVAVQWRASTAPALRCMIGSAGGAIDDDDSPAHAAFRDGLLEAASRPDISDAVVSELLDPGLVALIALDGSAEHADVAAAVREVAREGLLAHRRVLDRVIAARSRSALGA